MSDKDIRWQQRQQNFNKALASLELALAIEQPDIVQRAGIIQFFEMTFELAWKMLKDYLEEQGFTDLNSPRAVLKKAFEAELITEGHDWLQILHDRNLMSHTYDEATAISVENLIRHTYYPLLHTLHQTMLERG
ncbi:MAG: HI0074 family nucleotidyltransferase substrate-binding subunit [Anaerolineae bacterium]|jgi:nucleotidyltransferase substrate binding protein (TIGR01987 family)